MKAAAEPSNRAPHKPGAGVVHPRKFGSMFIATREGKEICYKFSKGAMGACAEPCADGRMHVCQHCLGAHPNAQCSKRDSGSKGAGKTPSK